MTGLTNKIQQALQWSYGRINGAAWLGHPWFQGSLVSLYSFYKRHLEDPYARLLFDFPQLLHHGSVLDIGANIGYTSLLFAEYLDAEYRVYAFEPEELNVRILRKQ